MKVDKNRFEYIQDEVVDKSVLHLGCLGHSAEKSELDTWTHRLIHEHAERAVGVDHLEKEVEKMQDSEFEITFGDAESLDLDEEFDIVFAGELIEHLTNFDGFLISVKKCLKPSGKLILTTPNCMAMYFWLQYLRSEQSPNGTHTCWFDRPTLEQLLSRYNFTPTEAIFAQTTPLEADPRNVAGYILERIFPARIGHRTLIMIAEQDDQ